MQSPRSRISYRTEFATGLSCRISPLRGTRGINTGSFPPVFEYEVKDCPFCRSRIFSSTCGFSNGGWITKGESVTFPNLYPFADRHTVTVITEAHMVESFTSRQLSDALFGAAQSLQDYPGYPSIHWNFLPSAGASLLHPHLQGMADKKPASLCRLYLEASAKTASGDYWEVVVDEEAGGPRHLFGEEIFWYANPVPIGECEIRGVLPIRTINELFSLTETLGRDIVRITDLFRSFGSYAFNMGVFFQKTGSSGLDGMCAFCTLIARINPNPESISDSAFMERICREPVVMTLPEDIRIKAGL
ncbi:galactose-1-phosphate uridylyltransferase [Methanocalculus taiwanensis]|uniref:Galactose-1-phosphate uridylyltransferase n=1 Tax=Methanocalculus taiwanensis TaxID=106207 RepID=A0ABD4TLQ6_9EURY|nr:galactose-1-phosphate uridylyltransferase [Methanocalculus taiwanensis]